MNTAEIIQKCRNGDRTAFGKLYEMYAERVFAIAFRILNNEDDAGDIVQETFISAWENLHRFNPDKQFRAWITRIAVNKCYDMLRKPGNKIGIVRDELQLAQLKSGDIDPADEMNNTQYGELIRMLTDKLSPKQKIVFVLVDLEECTHDEVSDITGMDKNSVKSNLNHARRNIGDLIRKYKW